MASSNSKPAEAAKQAAAETKKASSDFLHTPFMRGALPFINGGLAGMVATTCIQPIDMVKVRIQLAGEGVSSGPRPTPISVTREVIAAGRVLDLYTGLSAGLLRQAVYTTARMGFFDTFMGMAKASAEARGEAPGFKERAAAGLSAGGLAAFIGNPADLALIRMQSDGLRPKDQRQNYKSVVDALSRIAKNEGIAAWWSGCFPTVVRAMALNFGQLAFFSEAKSQLKERTQWSPPHPDADGQRRCGFLRQLLLPALRLPQDPSAEADARAGRHAAVPRHAALRRQSDQGGGRAAFLSRLQHLLHSDCAARVSSSPRIPLRIEKWRHADKHTRMITLIVADYLGFLTK